LEEYGVSLDVFIYGPGFGEAIILRWQNKSGTFGALVDGLGAGEGEWLAARLKALGIFQLKFLVATHPHLDHIENLAKAMGLLDWPVEYFWWWGGLGQQAFIEFYNRLASQHGRELQGTAAAVRDLLQDSRIAEIERNRPRVLDVGFGGPMYQEARASGPPLYVCSLSPCGGPLLRFARQVAGAIQRGGRIEHRYYDANLASISLLVEYGAAQIILGGDVEDANWSEMRRKPDLPKLRPSLVKVSHHGSRNGKIDGMWSSEGFFGRRGPSSLAVVTPWRPRFEREERRHLPDEETIEEICRAGFTTYVTGERDPEDLGRKIDSFVHVQVEEDGTAKVVDQAFTRRYEPKIA
jgi:hypothetical protein